MKKHYLTVFLLVVLQYWIGYGMALYFSNKKHEISLSIQKEKSYKYGYFVGQKQAYIGNLTIRCDTSFDEGFPTRLCFTDTSGISDWWTCFDTLKTQ
jgi:hypothetical protein